MDLLASFPQYTTNPPGEHETLGIVTGIAVVGANFLRGLMGGITDVLGGRSGGYQAVFMEARNIALAEMCLDAKNRGATLVGGVRLDYETLSNMLIVSASGTALRARSS